MTSPKLAFSNAVYLKSIILIKYIAHTDKMSLAISNNISINILTLYIVIHPPWHIHAHQYLFFPMKLLHVF